MILSDQFEVSLRAYISTSCPRGKVTLAGPRSLEASQVTQRYTYRNMLRESHTARVAR